MLILGSVPGIKSLEMQQYYAHPQNKFWHILFDLLNEPFSTEYSERINLVRSHGIALWDVIDTCERKGSLDSDIKDEEANDIQTLLNNHPRISAIFCNGQKSFKNLHKILGKNFPLPIFSAASTSPAYAGMKYCDKLESWRRILPYLQ